MQSYYLHIAACIVILTLNYQNKLEPLFNKFEQSIGLYTPPDTTEFEYIDPLYYVPPLERDSTKWRTLEANRAAELILWDSPNSVIQIKQNLNQFHASQYRLDYSSPILDYAIGDTALGLV
jgi:hypothetical protein